MSLTFLCFKTLHCVYTAKLKTRTDLVAIFSMSVGANEVIW